MRGASSSRARLARWFVAIGLCTSTWPALEGLAEARDRDATTRETEDESDVDSNVSSLSLTGSFMLRGGYTFGSGTRPAWVSPTTQYAIHRYGLEADYSAALDRDPGARPLGSALAVELHLGAFYSEEDPVMRNRDALPVELIGSAGLAGRVLSFGAPKRLALVLHANLEAAWGAQHWWSDTPRAAVLAGPRILSKFDDVGAEVDYSFVPDYLTGSPEGIEVDRWEHRVTASVSYGMFALGARHVIASERTRSPFPDILRSHANSTFLFLELRNYEE